MKHTQHSRFYNELLDVRDSSARVESKSGREVLDSLLTIIADNGLQKYFGIRLLHKHNDLGEREWMRESLRTDHEGSAIVTAAEDAGIGPARPNSWGLSKQGPVPVEFSDGELLVGGCPDDAANSLFAELGKVLEASGFAQVLGPCVLYSDAVDALKPSETSALLEKTDREARANILRFVERDSVDFRASVETKWSAERATDASGVPIWLATCTCFCSVSPKGGHLGTTVHRHEAATDPEKKG